MIRLLRKGHWVLTVLVGVPLLGWTLTGFAFTCFDFDEVRGASDRAPAEVVGEAPLSITDAVVAARALDPSHASVVQVRTRARLGRTVHVVELAPPHDPIVIDARDGSRVPPLTLAEAGALARASFQRDVGIRDARVVTTAAEAADVALPAYRVTLDDRLATQVFVAPETGEILAWRNDAYRSFDRLWSLHVFGFVSRDSPAQWPLRVASCLALLAALTGWGLLLASLARRAAPLASRFTASSRRARAARV